MFINEERSPVEIIARGCARKENRTNAALVEESIGNVPDNMSSDVYIRGEAERANSAVKIMSTETADKVLLYIAKKIETVGIV